MLCSTGLLPRGKERHAAGPKPEAAPRTPGVLCLQPQDGGGLKQDRGAAEPIPGDQDPNQSDHSDG